MISYADISSYTGIFYIALTLIALIISPHVYCFLLKSHLDNKRIETINTYPFDKKAIARLETHLEVLWNNKKSINVPDSILFITNFFKYKISVLEEISKYRFMHKNYKLEAAAFSLKISELEENYFEKNVFRKQKYAQSIVDTLNWPHLYSK